MHIFPGGVLPGIVDLHPIYLKPPPRVRISVREEGLINALDESVAGVRTEFEACPATGDRVEIFDCILQPADGPDHRNRSVSKAIHLIQPARLEFRRHQKDVGPGLDLMSKTLIVSTIDAHLRG